MSGELVAGQGRSWADDDHARTGTVEFFGVRHHSPGGARLLEQRLRDEPPAVLLVEGPPDFNPRIEELGLDHELPISIYAWAPEYPDAEPGSEEFSRRRGAFYPFSGFSPEWVGIRTALALGIPVEFIDLPWPLLAPHARAENRFADPPSETEADGDPAAPSAALESLLQRMGVDDLDALIDELIEVDPQLPLDTYRERMDLLGRIMRRDRAEDRVRERYMAARIREACAAHAGSAVPVLVVCGAAHVAGLEQELAAAKGVGEPPRWEAPAGDDRYGIALTPTSYAVLDALTGYNAGQPNPGFYDALFGDREAGRTGTAQRLLAELTEGLRDSHQRISVADVIAVRVTGESLAALRGHPEMWRTDLVDAVRSALVKDEVGAHHPLLARVNELLRGSKVGQLAEGVSRPPLTVELTRALEARGLAPTPERRAVHVDLETDDGLESSRLLHSLRVLGAAAGTLVEEGEADGVEVWALQWTPEFEAGLVECARFGATREEAVQTRLVAGPAGAAPRCWR